MKSSSVESLIHLGQILSYTKKIKVKVNVCALDCVWIYYRSFFFACVFIYEMEESSVGSLIHLVHIPRAQ